VAQQDDIVLMVMCSRLCEHSFHFTYVHQTSGQQQSTHSPQENSSSAYSVYRPNNPFAGHAIAEQLQNFSKPRHLSRVLSSLPRFGSRKVAQ
jgi:hypothetical protein